MRKNNRNKKLMCLLCGSLLAAALTGCGKAEETQPEAEKQRQESQTEQDSQQPVGNIDDAGQDSQQAAEDTDNVGQDSQQPVESTDDIEQDGEPQPAGNEVQAGESASIRVWGPLLRVEDGNLLIDNRSDVSFRGEMILAADKENTRILDGKNGYPVDVSELSEDEVIFAYLEPAATLSEPPVMNASLILCKLPDDLRIPDYVRVTAMEEQSDGSYLLSGDNEIQYLVPGDCEILPYLTRNIVTLQDVQTDSRCLVWSDERRAAQKIVLFAD